MLNDKTETESKKSRIREILPEGRDGGREVLPCTTWERAPASGLVFWGVRQPVGRVDGRGTESLVFRPVKLFG